MQEVDLPRKPDSSLNISSGMATKYSGAGAGGPEAFEGVFLGAIVDG